MKREQGRRAFIGGVLSSLGSGLLPVRADLRAQAMVLGANSFYGKFVVHRVDPSNGDSEEVTFTNTEYARTDTETLQKLIEVSKFKVPRFRAGMVEFDECAG